jgi:hypothetical protein
MSMPGQDGLTLLKTNMMAAVPTPSATAAGVTVGRADVRAAIFGKKAPGSSVKPEAAEVLHLTGENGCGNAGGKSYRDGMRDVADQRSQSQGADDRQRETGKEHHE